MFEFFKHYKFWRNGSSSKGNSATVEHRAAGLGLMIGALGVVYGDIGTSPLYTMSEAFFGHYPLERTHENIFGVVSLVFWSLVLVVTVKYIGLIMRADNNGEGGVFALLGLLKKDERPGAESKSHLISPWLRSTVLVAILIGACLLYGDGIITPAISVLSAVEGLSVLTPAAGNYEVAITVIILAGLFVIQKRGTHRIGGLFGPIMSVWFIVIAILGLRQIIHTPKILEGLNPWHAILLAREHGWRVFLVLGAVVLCITGVEAMYADLGHFGRSAITRAWTFLVLPCLMLNYLGQGAFLLTGRHVAQNHLFYALTPQPLILPMVVLATIATVIASQALITGAFSLTQQAIALGLFPRLRIVHTNPEIRGQIFIPFVNTALFLGCIWLVLTFRHSTNLAAAYGIAVTGTMTVTTIAFSLVAMTIFKWPKRYFVPIMIPIMLIDLCFFASNLSKFTQGGYVPILVGFAVFVVMDTWRWGRNMVGKVYRKRIEENRLSVRDIIENKPKYLDSLPSVSIVVMASRPITSIDDFIPPLLTTHYQNWRRLPKHIIFLSIIQTGQPFVRKDQRYDIHVFARDDSGTVISVEAHYGYMETPNVRKALMELKQKKLVKLPQDPKRWLILVGTERFITPGKTWLDRLRIGLFSRMNRLAKPAIDYFGLESDSAVVTETINV